MFKEELKNFKSKNWNEIKTKLIEVAEKIIPLKRIKKHRWWTEDCDKALDRRIEMWRKWYSNKNPTNLINFKRIRKETAKIIRNAKRQYDRNQLQEIEENFRKNKTTDFYKIFRKETQKYQPPSLCFKKENESLALTI